MAIVVMTHLLRGYLSPQWWLLITFWLKHTWYVPLSVSQLYCNGVLKIMRDNKASRNFKTENTLFQKRKMWSSLLYDVTQHISQNSKISCFVATWSITFFFLKKPRNYNLKLSHMDVCIILQKKHLTVYKHSCDCFQHYPFSVTLLLLD